MDQPIDPNSRESLPETIRETYRPLLGYAYGDPRYGVVRINRPNQLRIEVVTTSKTDVWIWDTDNPGHGRWLQIA
jgi:hypothetical protein